MFEREWVLSLAAAALLAGTTRAQSITQIVLAGDSVPGVGNVTLVNGLTVDNAGSVFVHVLTDNPNQNTNAALVDVNGSAVVKEGDALAQPSGAFIISFNGGELRCGSNGPVLYLQLGGTSGPQDDTGIYLSVPPALGLQLGAFCTAPEVPTNSRYTIMLPPMVNGSNQICFHGVIDDPNITGMYNTDVLCVVDPGSGVQHARYKENQILPGQTWGIQSFNWDNNGLGFNDAGDVMFGATTFAASGQNQVIYLNNTKLAQTSEMSPFGTPYTSLATSIRALCLNNSGDYVFSCGVNNISTGDGIVVNGNAFVQAADFLPSIDPYKIEQLGQPLFIGDDGRVLWSATWLTPGGVQSRGLFIDYTLLVEQGVTQINGLLVQSMTLLDRSFSLSPSGQYVLFEATLENGKEGAFLIDLWS